MLHSMVVACERGAGRVGSSTWTGGFLLRDAAEVGADEPLVDDAEPVHRLGVGVAEIGQRSGPRGDAYAPGQFYASGSGVPSDCIRLGDCDLNFRFTAITPAAAVPEPATWGMMAAGFGVAGAALRRSRRERAAATS